LVAYLHFGGKSIAPLLLAPNWLQVIGPTKVWKLHVLSTLTPP